MARLNPHERFQRALEDIKDATTEMLGNDEISFEERRDIVILTLNISNHLSQLVAKAKNAYPVE